MKKLKLISNGKFKLENSKIPRLGKDSSIIKLDHVGICSSDVNRSFGNGAYFFPLVMGHEAMGVVHKSNGNLKIGDKVVIFPLKPCFKCSSCLRLSFQTCASYSYHGSREDGAYQEFLRVNNWNILKLADQINNADAALIEPTAVMVHVKNILLNSSSSKKEFLNLKGAIIGGGFLSMVLSRIFSCIGAIAPDLYDRNAYKIEFGKAKGIDAFHSATLGSNTHKYDWVIEASGDPKSFEQSIEIVKSNGKLVWMSNVNKDVKLSSTSISNILRKELTILGSWNSSFHPTGKSDWKESIKLINSGLSPSEFVTHYVSLDEVPEILNKFHQHKIRRKEFKAIKAMLNHQKK